MRPLDGILVVAMEHAVAAPFATRQLADLGARVIKIERPGTGDFARGYDAKVKGLSSHFVWINRSKESLTLDVKDARARDALTRLLERADVFVQNLAPGAAARLGLDFDSLKRINPRIVVCDISGYGEGGPFTQKKAYDLLVQCESGLVSITGTKDEVVKASIAVADIAAGMYALTSILAALHLRRTTNEGSRIEISMLEALGEWMGYPLYYAMHSGDAPPRSGAFHSSIAPYGPYRTGDGRSIFFGVQNEREWKILCENVLERPGMVADPRFASNSARSSHRVDLTGEIEAALSALTLEEATGRLEKAGIANARLNAMADFAAHEQLAARDRWRDVGTPAGPIPMLKPPFDISGTEPRMDPVPDVGAHTTDILEEIGFDQATIESMRRDGVI